MLTLDTASVPTTTADWRDAIVAALRHRIGLSPTVQLDGDLPALDRLNIELSGGNVEAFDAPDVVIVGHSEPGPTLKLLRVAAHPLSFRDIPTFLEISATSVALVTGFNAAGNVVVAMSSAQDGHLHVAIDRKDLDVALLAAACAGAAAHGVEILAVQSRIESDGPRTLNVAVDLTGKKFVKFTVRITGRLSIDDALTATATDLKVEGSGMAAGFAAGLLRSQLTKLEGQRLPLMQFSLGTVHLRDVAVETTDGLAIRATFGAA